MAKVVTAHQWSTAWNRTLERLGVLVRGAPMSHGRQRTRIKRIEALIGRVQAEVQEQTQGNCQVTLKFAPLTERAWLQLVMMIENQIQSSGQRHVEELFREPAPFFTEISGLLLPTQTDELTAECTCCSAEKKNCPACELVYRQVGALLDEEPILLLRLHGREWQTLQQALQARRKDEYLGGLPTAGVANGAINNATTPATQSGPVAPNNDDLERELSHFWGSRKALESLHYYIAPPTIELALLRRLGPLPAMLDEHAGRSASTPALDQAMAQIYRQVTQEAQALAYSLDTTEPSNPTESHPVEVK